MWCRYSYEAQLVFYLIYLFALHQFIVRKKFKIIFYLASIDPCKGVKPLEDQYQFCDQDINGVFLPDMKFFVQENLVIRFPVIQ